MIKQSNDCLNIKSYAEALGSVKGETAMRKTIKLQALDCANCAAKMENAIARLQGVNEVKVNFMSQKLVLDAADECFDAVLEQAKRAAKKIEPGIVFLA